MMMVMMMMWLMMMLMLVMLMLVMLLLMVGVAVAVAVAAAAVVVAAAAAVAVMVMVRRSDFNADCTSGCLPSHRHSRWLKYTLLLPQSVGFGCARPNPVRWTHYAAETNLR